MNQPFSRPSTILGSAASGLPSLRAMRLDRGALGGDLGLRHLVPAEVARPGEGDVDGDVVGQLLGRRRATRHDHGVHAATGLQMEVGVDGPSASASKRTTSPTEMFSLQRGLQSVDLVRARSATASSPLAATRCGQLVGQIDEVGGLGHEVGLAAQLDDGGASPSSRHGHGALGGLAIRALGRAGQALLPQPLGRLRPCRRRSLRAPAWRRASRRRWPGAEPGRPWR